MKHIFTRIAACAAAVGYCALNAFAAGDMTFRLTVADQSAVYLTADSLKAADTVLSGKFWIDNYTAFTGMKTILTSDAPIVIENGAFTQPYFFKSASYRSYTQKSVVNGDTNIVMWTGPDSLETGVAVCEVANPGGSFAEFDVRVPQGTEAGVYQLGFRQGITTGATGIVYPDTYVQNDTEDVPTTFAGCKVIVEPDAMRGDVDCDGKITLTDAKRLLDYVTYTQLAYMTPNDAETAALLGTEYIHTAQQAGDASLNGALGHDDAALILRYFVQMLSGVEPSWD